MSPQAPDAPAATTEDPATPAKAPKPKKTAAAAPTKAPVSKAKTNGKAHAKANGSAKAKPEKKEDSIRLRVFKLLNSKPTGYTGPQIKEKLGLTGVPALLKDEGMRAKAPRIARQEIEGVRGVVYVLTPAGKQAIKDGTVDSEAAPRATGDWQNNR